MIRLSAVTVSVMAVLACIGAACPRGRLTGSECRLCIESDASMNVTSRKNITSIIGMISMRPCRGLRDLRSFKTHRAFRAFAKAYVVDQPRAETLHLIKRLGLQPRKKVKSKKRYQRNEKA